MRAIKSMKALENLGRVQLSPNFFMRDFLYSEIGSFYGIPNIPDDPDHAIAAARGLCETILEPLTTAFGKISIRSGYRSRTLNAFGNERKHNCGSNEYNLAGHIFDSYDKDGNMGATATIVVNAFVPHYEATQDWTPLAWFIHDHIPYQQMWFFPKLAAFNITWNEARADRVIKSYVAPRGKLTAPGMENWGGDHSGSYDLPLFEEAKERLG